MVYIYLKNLRKTWLVNLIGPITIASFVGSIASGWTSLKQLMLDRVAAMDNPIYMAIFGDLGITADLATNPWQASILMYGAGTAELVLLFVAIFIPARLLTQEIDKRNLDVMLSYPVPRWRYLLEKYSVYLTYNFLYPILLIVLMLGSTAFLGEEINVGLVVSYALGTWFTLFALGAISLLCATIFLDSSKSLGVAAMVILGQYLMVSLGGIIDFIADFQFLSIFNYLKINAIREAGTLPLNEVFIVSAVGVMALATALYIFNKREFAI